MPTQYCFLCGSDEGVFLDINAGNCSTIHEQLEICSFDKVAAVDKLPKKICHKCAYELHQCSTFVQKYKQAARSKKARAHSQKLCCLCLEPQRKGYIFDLQKDSNSARSPIHKIQQLFNYNVHEEVNKLICLTCRYTLDVLCDLKCLFQETSSRLGGTVNEELDYSTFPKTQTRVVSRKTTKVEFDTESVISISCTDGPLDTMAKGQSRMNKVSNKELSQSSKSRICNECHNTVPNGDGMYRFHSTQQTVCKNCWLVLDPSAYTNKNQKRSGGTKLCSVFLKDILTDVTFKKEKVYRVEEDTDGNKTYIITDESSEGEGKAEAVLPKLKRAASADVESRNRKPSLKRSVRKTRTSGESTDTEDKPSKKHRSNEKQNKEGSKPNINGTAGKISANASAPVFKQKATRSNSSLNLDSLSTLPKVTKRKPNVKAKVQRTETVSDTDTGRKLRNLRTIVEGVSASKTDISDESSSNEDIGIRRKRTRFATTVTEDLDQKSDTKKTKTNSVVSEEVVSSTSKAANQQEKENKRRMTANRASKALKKSQLSSGEDNETAEEEKPTISQSKKVESKRTRSSSTTSSDTGLSGTLKTRNQKRAKVSPAHESTQPGKPDTSESEDKYTAGDAESNVDQDKKVESKRGSPASVSSTEVAPSEIRKTNRTKRGRGHKKSNTLMKSQSPSTEDTGLAEDDKPHVDESNKVESRGTGSSSASSSDLLSPTVRDDHKRRSGKTSPLHESKELDKSQSSDSEQKQTPEEDKPYVCNECGSIYENKLDGMAHKLTHCKQLEVKLSRVVVVDNTKAEANVCSPVETVNDTVNEEAEKQSDNIAITVEDDEEDGVVDVVSNSPVQDEVLPNSSAIERVTSPEKDTEGHTTEEKLTNDEASNVDVQECEKEEVLGPSLKESHEKKDTETLESSPQEDLELRLSKDSSSKENSNTSSPRKEDYDDSVPDKEIIHNDKNVEDGERSTEAESKELDRIEEATSAKVTQAETETETVEEKKHKGDETDKQPTVLEKESSAEVPKEQKQSTPSEDDILLNDGDDEVFNEVKEPDTDTSKSNVQQTIPASPKETEVSNHDAEDEIRIGITDDIEPEEPPMKEPSQSLKEFEATAPGSLEELHADTLKLDASRVEGEKCESADAAVKVLQEVFDLAAAEVQKRHDSDVNIEADNQEDAETLENISREIHNSADMPSLDSVNTSGVRNSDVSVD